MSRFHRFCVYFLLVFTSMSTLQYALAEEFTVSTVANDLGTPWGMAMLPDNSMLITDRDGYLTRLNLSTGQRSDISGLPWNILVIGQGGLFDVAITSDEQQSVWVYLSYSKNIDGRGATTLARAQLDDNASLKNWQDLLITKSTSPTSIHFAGRITFDQQGHVYMSIGDRGIRNNAQDLSNHAGTIIRLNFDGSIPNDNPFVNDDSALDEIWSYGHRNPQGLFFNKNTGELWSSEHGPRGGDEINLINPGLNYGWPVISYGKEYGSARPVGESTHKQGMEQPVKVYTPSIAPSSLIQYQGNAFPHWQGTLFSGALKLRHLNQVTLDNSNKASTETRLLSNLSERIRNVIESPEGWLYVSTDSGKLLRLKPNNESIK